MLNSTTSSDQPPSRVSCCCCVCVHSTLTSPAAVCLCARLLLLCLSMCTTPDGARAGFTRGGAASGGDSSVCSRQQELQPCVCPAAALQPPAAAAAGCRGSTGPGPAGPGGAVGGVGAHVQPDADTPAHCFVKVRVGKRLPAGIGLAPHLCVCWGRGCRLWATRHRLLDLQGCSSLSQGPLTCWHTRTLWLYSQPATVCQCASQCASVPASHTFWLCGPCAPTDAHLCAPVWLSVPVYLCGSLAGCVPVRLAELCSPCVARVH